MNDDAGDAGKRWYHQIPNWVTAAAIVLGGLTAGVGAYGQIAGDSKKLEVLEPKVSTLEIWRAGAEVQARDEADRLKRIEDKLDAALRERNNGR